MGTADRLRMLSESLLAEILEQVQTKSEVDLEICVGCEPSPGEPIVELVTVYFISHKINLDCY